MSRILENHKSLEIALLVVISSVGLLILFYFVDPNALLEKLGYVTLTVLAIVGLVMIVLREVDGENAN